MSLGLGFLGIDRNELWFDEAYSALIAGQSLSGILSELQYDSSPPFYYALLHLWSELVGSGPAALRSLSVIAAALAVFFTERLGTRLWGSQVGPLGALLLALSPLHVYYSQQARPYSLFLALVLASLLFHEQARQSDSRLATGLWMITTILAIYTHNYGLFLLPVYALSAVLDRRSGRFWISLITVSLAYCLWIPYLSAQVRVGATDWVERIWRNTPPAMALVKSIAGFAIGGLVPDYVPLGSPPPIAWLPFISVSLFVYLVFRSCRVQGNRGAASRRVATALGLVLAIPYLASFVKPIYIVGRYDLVGLPLFLLLAAAGWWSLSPRAARVVGCLLAVLGTASLYRYYSQLALVGVESQAKLLVGHSTSLDSVVCTGFTRNPLEYYVRELGGSISFLSFPLSSGLHRGWIDERELTSPDQLALDARTLAGDLLKSREPGRVWIAHSRLAAQSTEPLVRTLANYFVREPCPEGGDRLGFSCWNRRPAN